MEEVKYIIYKLIAAKTVAKYRPYCDIFAVSFEEATIKGLTLVRGV